MSPPMCASIQSPAIIMIALSINPKPIKGIAETRLILISCCLVAGSKGSSASVLGCS